jgi:hypothetical protein
MTENRKRILEMLADKKISVEEAERLLTLTEDEESKAEQPSETPPERKKTGKYLRVLVEPGPGNETGHKAEKVNVRIPMNLIRAGIKLTALIPPQAADKVNETLKEKGIDFDLRNLKPDDLEELVEALADFEVDIDSGREKVHVYVE